MKHNLQKEKKEKKRPELFSQLVQVTQLTLAKKHK